MLNMSMCLLLCVVSIGVGFFFNDTATTEIYTLSLHDALPIWVPCAATSGVPPSPAYRGTRRRSGGGRSRRGPWRTGRRTRRSEEHTSELQSRQYLVCRLLLEKKINCYNLVMCSTKVPL